MESIREQIKDICQENGLDYESACDVADDLGFDGDLGDAEISISFVLESFENAIR